MREVGYHPHSGLCRLRGEEILLIDWELAPDLQIELFILGPDPRPAGTADGAPSLS